MQVAIGKEVTLVTLEGQQFFWSNAGSDVNIYKIQFKEKLSRLLQVSQVVRQLGYVCYQIRVSSSIGSLQCDLQFAERCIDVIIGTIIQARCIDARVRLVDIVLQTDLQLRSNGS